MKKEFKTFVFKDRRDVFVVPSDIGWLEGDCPELFPPCSNLFIESYYNSPEDFREVEIINVVLEIKEDE